MINETQKIECPICKNSFRVLHPNGHLKMHGITSRKQFEQMFPNYQMSYSAYADKVYGIKEVGGYSVRALRIAATKNGTTLHAEYNKRREDSVKKTNAREGIELVTCQLCGQRIKRMASHLNHKHGMTVAEYVAQFPNAKTVTVRSANKTTRTCKERGIFAKGIFAMGQHPNKLESAVSVLLKKHFGDMFVYTGDGSKFLFGMNPDFTCRYSKKVIEVFGDYWHTDRVGMNRKDSEALRVANFRKHGYDCLVIWESDFRSNPVCVKNRIARFIGLEGSETTVTASDRRSEYRATAING